MKALDRLRTLARLDALRDRPDADLVRLFADRRDEAAFELLVRRHGPLVAGVCRRALGDPATADDAFQATFLLLARRAPALREPAGVARWLYGTAGRVASEARRQARRRRRRERAAARPEATRPPTDDTAAAVDAAVRRLPEPYRSAVLLCDLGGASRERAAAELGVPPGTVASRVGRGRQLLAADLTRRGVTLGVLAAAVPAGLAESTARVAGLVAAGEPAPAAVGTLLVHGGRMMLGLKAAVVGLVVGGGAVLAWPGGQPADPPVVVPKAATPAERLAKLRTEFSEAFQVVADAQQAAHQAGKPVPDLKGPTEQPERFLPPLLELGESADEPTAAAALSFAVHAYGLPRGRFPDADKAWRRLCERFRNSPHLIAFANEPLGNRGGVQSLEEQMLLVATDHATRGHLEFRMAVAGDPTISRMVGPIMKDEYDAYRRTLTTARYRRIVETYADVDDGKLAQQAERRLAGLAPPEHLIVGKSAPKTVGADLDGKPMDLAEFKGKVVVLEFWGSWCGPCIKATPGLKQLAAKYADKDVVVLGVMAETDPGAARKTAADLGVPWRNWLDPRTEGRSPLVAAWDVRGFPTTVVLDRAGVIRSVNPGHGEELAKAVEAALVGR